MTVIHSDHLQLIRTAYPDLHIRSVSKHQGQFNHVLIVNERYVFRIPRSIRGERTLAREIVLLDKIRERVSLPVPNPTLNYVDPDTHIPVFTGYELIPGQPLRGGTLNRINDTRVLNHLARQIGVFLRELHSIPIEEVGHELPTGELPAEWAEFYNNVRRQLYPHMRRDARKHVDAHFEEYFNNLGRYSFKPRLRHGDFGSGNILFDARNKTVSGVIDFGSAGPGDPAQDVGALLVSLGHPFVNRMFNVYPQMIAMLRRAAFYMGTYAMQEALAGLQDGDPDAFEAGIAGFR
jgi:aminoglycoside 2''-phosphotransferase